MSKALTTRSKRSRSGKRVRKTRTKRMPMVNPSHLQPVYRALEPGGIPNQTIVKHRHCAQGQFLVGTTTASAVWTDYRANGISATTPMGYDQWKTHFQHYVVLGARTHVTLTPQLGAGSPSGLTVCLRVADEVGGGTIGKAIENGRASYTVLNSNSGQTAVLRAKYNAARRFGTSNPRHDDALIAAATAEPTQTAYFSLGGSHNTGTTEANPVYVNYCWVIDYIVMWLDPKTLAASS